jgi:hypothetical protein
MIHLGYEAAALERRGIATERGDYNRAVQKRNLSRLAEGVASGVRNQNLELARPHAANAEREALKTEQGQESAENVLKEKSQDEALKTARHLNMLKEKYAALEKDLAGLITERNEGRQEIPRLLYKIEQLDEHAKNVAVLQGRVEGLQGNRQNLGFLQWAKKQEVDKAISRAEQDLSRAEFFFKNRFYVDPSQAAEEIKQIQEKVRVMESDVHTKNAAILDIMGMQDKILLGYHTQKLLAEAHHDKDKIALLLEKLNRPPESVRDRLLHERIDRRLNIIPEESFQKVIEKLPPYQAHILTNIREQAKERERLKEIEKERHHTYERSR